MDINKQKPTTSSHKRWLIIGSVCLFCLYLIILLEDMANRTVLSKKDLVIAEVKQGNLDITINGYGKLRPLKQEVITAMTAATVKEILLKPGVAVNNNELIAILENPELAFELKNHEQQLAQLLANLRQLQLNQQREVLNEESQLAMLEAALETATLKRTAEQSLVEKGIVSRLKFNETKLNEKQLQTRIKLKRKALENLNAVHHEAVLIQKEVIKQQTSAIEIAQTRVDALQIRAKFTGVLQRLPIALGQSVTPGQELALLGSTDEFIAEIYVPQTQANKLRIGQKARVDTREQIITGELIRIDPVVKDNSVMVELTLSKNTPKSLRPEQNVDVEIIAETLHNSMYIDRPAKLNVNQYQDIYYTDEQQQKALLSQIKFGEKAGRYVTILDGAHVGQRFILTDLSNYKHEVIILN